MNLSERLEQAYAGAVYDVLRAMGYANQALPHEILPLEKNMKVAGPVFIGGLTISNGDYIFADRDGVLVIPGDIAEEATNQIEEVLTTESKVRNAIVQDGLDPQVAYLKYNKF